ncbi:helix-turn-helix domain-containing protein [Streptomyces sp. NPDC059037]|uniref:helix-turn-helix domain-containing protein n=1 Tax=Streptomyces sp. NPDC059037 TaxID=3346710 RepID=UPI0036B4949D
MTDQQLNAPPCAPPAVPTSGIRHINRRHPERFTVVGNHLTQHRELSLTAIGLAAHIQSLPAGAKVTIKCLADRFPEGEVRIAAALRELEAHGYLTRTRERLSSGRVVTRTVSYNNPPAMRVSSPPLTCNTPQPPRPAAAPLDDPPKEHRAAAALLTDLRRHDPRLLLAERDVRRLAPAATAWLERGIDPEAVRRTLTAGLPNAPIHHPAALLTHRLREFLPPPLPALSRPDPLQNCDHCDRAFRAPKPGHCRDCTASPATVTA